MGNTITRKKEALKHRVKDLLNKKQCEGCPKKQYSWENCDVLGSGENSIVYKGTDQNQKEKYAIKRVESFALTKETLTRLNHEASILNEVSQIKSHSNRYIRLHEGFIDKSGALCIVTELIEGFELLKLAEMYGNGIPEEIVKKLMKQILEAIYELHANDIAHLDLKLENIMFDTETNQIKIIDFGFACKTSTYNREKNQTEQIKLKEFRGSPHYVAPQLILSRPFDGKKADIWALGVLAYTLLLCKFPFRGGNYNEIFKSALNRTPVLPSFVSSDAQDFISIMLSRDESMRPDVKTLLSHKWLKNVNTDLDVSVFNM